MTSPVLTILISVSFIAGIIVGYMLLRLDSKGTIRIVHAPEKDKYSFEIDRLDALEMYDFVTLRVKIEDEEFEKTKHQ